jgi:predicted negative regulator of RcsB-dependent stress response
VEDLSEKEQLDAMRAWWQENGRFVIGGIVLGVAIIIGWNQWRGGIAEKETAASALYEDVMSATGDGNLDAANTAASELFESYPATIYASQSRLAMARLYMDKGRDQDAADVLRVLVESGGDSEIQLVGRLRLARVLLYQDKAEEVVELLRDQGEHAFAARYSEVLGDAYTALGSYPEAQAAYTAALADDPAVRTVDSGLIQLKLNDLPAATAVASGTEAATDAAEAVEEAPPVPGDEQTSEQTGDQADVEEGENGDEAAQ